MSGCGRRIIGWDREVVKSERGMVGPGQSRRRGRVNRLCQKGGLLMHSSQKRLYRKDGKIVSWVECTWMALQSRKYEWEAYVFQVKVRVYKLGVCQWEMWQKTTILLPSCAIRNVVSMRLSHSSALMKNQESWSISG